MYIRIAHLMFVLSIPVSVFSQTQQFIVAGIDSFLVPTSVVSLKVECIGGGGSGGRVTPSNPFDDDAAGGGGGGAYASSIVVVTGGNSYPVTVGSGGINNGTSTDGGNSFFGNGLTVLAEGGKTRSGNDNTAGANGGLAANSIGTVKYNGGNGGNGDEGNADGGGGGGAAGTGGNGYNGSGLSGGGPQSSYGGNGGNGGDDGAHGTPGANYGGGGGGSSAQGSNDRDGGPGSQGIVIITWSELLSFSPDTICNSAGGNVIVNGTNFVDVDSVLINGVNIPFTVNSSTQITITIPSGTGSGLIKVVTGNGACRSNYPLEIINNSVNITASGGQLTANYTGVGFPTYQWIDCINGNNPIAGATNSVFTPVQNGLYALITTISGCQETSSCFAITNVGLDEVYNNSCTVYPNPATDIIQFKSEVEMNVMVFDMLGKLVYQTNNANTLHSISVIEWTKGIYSYRANSINGMSTGKLIKNE